MSLGDHNFDLNKVLEIDYSEVSKLDLAHFYHHGGCLIVRNVIEPELIKEIQNRLIGFFKSILIRKKVDCDDSDTLDTTHQKAAKALGPERNHYLLTIGKDFPAFKNLLASADLLSVVEQLLNTKEIQSADDSNVLRVDRPSSTLTNLPWHQDYPYNMLSINAVTSWMPLLPVDEDMGRVSVVMPKNELYPIEYDHIKKKEFHNSRYIQIKDLDKLQHEFDQNSSIVPEVNPGDALLMHSLLLHKSGVNRSDKSRWVATARYGTLDCDTMSDRNWFAARAKYPDIFKNYHPELFFEKHK